MHMIFREQGAVRNVWVVSGKKAYFVAQAPSLFFHVQDCFFPLETQRNLLNKLY